MATLTPQVISPDGDAITPVAAAGGGDSVNIDAHGFLLVTNGGGSPVTVTMVVPGSEYGVARADIATSVPAGATRYFGPLVADLADTDGLIDITYSGVTSVTVAHVRLPAG